MHDVLEAILSDMDGVLVDSETLGISIAVEVCSTYGIDLTDDEKQSFIGVSDDVFYTKLFQSRGVDFDPMEALTKHTALYEERLPNAKGFKESVEFITIARGLFKLALISGSTRKQVDVVLKSIGLEGVFEVIISCDDVENGKPNPEGYLRAAAELGVDPSRCVVLEDAEKGVRAAKAAGMFCIGIRNGNEKQDLSLADIRIKTLFPELIDSLL
ncbi:MAG: HAD family phosphatase [Candidatus Gracilibacteria bacterium]|jgi:HAD superfamily hydrolase (TIGR01509 family)